MSVQLRAGAVAARAKFDGGNVLQAYQLPHLARADDDVGKLFCWFKRPSPLMVRVCCWPLKTGGVPTGLPRPARSARAAAPRRRW